jgi:hypothetical protein
MTVGAEGSRSRWRFGLAGRVAGLVTAAVVVALVPAMTASAQPGPPVADRALAAAGTISTVAGGVGGPAPGPSVAVAACGVKVAGGLLYVGGGGVVRQVSLSTGELATAAGAGVLGPVDDGAPATQAYLNNACGVSTDGFGNLVIADQGNNRVRVAAASTGTFYGQAMTAGDIYTVAGDGNAGFFGDGGPATAAEMNSPAGVVVDGAGNLVIADQGNNRVRVVAASTGAFYGQAMTAGDIYTVAGGGVNGLGDGLPATFAELHRPEGVKVDASGNLVIADAFDNRVRVVAASTGTFYGRAMTGGDIYTVAGDGTAGFAGDGGPATAAELNTPAGVVVDGAGNLVIADQGNNRVRVVAASTGRFYGRAMTAGHIYTVAGDGTAGFAGDGGPATAAQLHGPAGVAVYGSGNLVIADGSNNRVRVVAAKTGTSFGQAMTAGDIYTVAGDGYLAFSGDGGPATAAEFGMPGWVTADGAGMVIADRGNCRIRVVAAKTGRFYQQAMTAGDVYTVAGDGKCSTSGSQPNGVPARSTNVNADTVAVDHAGNILAAEGRFIRVVAVKTGAFYGQAMTAGDIYTVAGDGQIGFSGDGGPATSAQIHAFGGLAQDAAGNLVFADTGNDRIQVVAATAGTFYGQPMNPGDIYTVAGGGTGGDGGPGTAAKLKVPLGLALDGAGNVVIGDQRDFRVRVLAATTGTFYGQAMTTGDIYTVAGGGCCGLGDGGPATAASLEPAGVAVDGTGNLVIADPGNDRIRVVATTTGTFYGQAMTTGDIYTVAGDGNIGFSGDGGPATTAMLANPADVAVDSAGNLLIADPNNHRIRAVTP